MKQVLLKKGTVYTPEIAEPMIQHDMVLVQTVCSCISAGTEMAGVQKAAQNAKTPLLQRALSDPELMKKGLKMLRERGLKNTYEAANKTHEIGTAMGYTASGIVIASGTSEFCEGDRVACMGAGYANHAGCILVPKNLVARLPDGVSFKEGSTAALGCIAMQGVRRADVTLGEYVVITGMGILGQLAARLAIASGATVIVTDMDVRRLEIAKKAGARYCLSAQDNVVDAVNRITGGHGADKVIVTAATSSDALLSQAFQMCRRHGRVVLVGVAGMNLKREDMYKKELEFRISTSYGPGRYDTSYEEGGVDYPYDLARFTEKRNLESYLRLLEEKRIGIADIIEKVYPAERANEAYGALKVSKDRPLMVLLEYAQPEEKTAVHHVIIQKSFAAPQGTIRVALCGAGRFAKGIHLPNLQKMKDKYSLYAVQSRTGANAQAIATKYGAKYATTDYNQILQDKDVDMVIICTRPNMHADMAERALRAGKAVFVEKPMALTAEENERVIQAARETGAPLLVGFNRRFSRYIQEVHEIIKNRVDPMIVSYRMNAGFIPLDHWVQSEIGGGRITGEGCHILDVFTYLTGANAQTITVNQISPTTDRVTKTDNCVITVKYEDGSVCTLTYTGQGSKEYGKEFCEIFVDGKVLVVDDYKELRGYGIKTSGLKTAGSEKGQLEELEAFYDAIKNGDGYPIPLWQLEQTTILSIMGQNA